MGRKAGGRHVPPLAPLGLQCVMSDSEDEVINGYTLQGEEYEEVPRWVLDLHVDEIFDTSYE